MSLGLDLITTEDCNLKCSYCYMNQHKNMMEYGHIKPFMESIAPLLKIYGQSTYNIIFFGGEPLLNWRLIEAIAPTFKADPRCDGMSLITNGLLLDPAKVTFLRAMGCRVSLSFDGLWNDFARPLRDGTPSLPSYLARRDLFHQMGLHTCKVMVSPQAAGSLLENFLFLVDTFHFPAPKFALIRDDIWSWEDVATFKTQLPLLSQEIVNRFKAGYPNTVGFFTLMLSDIFYAVNHGKRNSGCFAGCSGLAYHTDGLFYPCSRFGSEQVYPVYDAHLQKANPHNIAVWKDSKVSDPRTYQDCTDCEIRLYCNGGCVKSLYEKGRGQIQPIPQVCALYKEIYRETLNIHRELRGNPTYQAYVKNNLVSN